MEKKIKNKKLLVIVAIIVIAVIAVLVFKSYGSSGGSVTTGGGVFSSIKDAIAKSLSLKCEYDTGSGKTIAYVKGGNIRIEGAWQEQKNYAAVIKDNKLYSWDSEKKEGIIMPLEVKEGEQTIAEGFVSGLETQKNYCKVAVFSDNVFDPPADIKFQDLGDLQNLMVPNTAE